MGRPIHRSPLVQALEEVELPPCDRRDPRSGNPQCDNRERCRQRYEACTVFSAYCRERAGKQKLTRDPNRLIYRQLFQVEVST